MGAAELEPGGTGGTGGIEVGSALAVTVEVDRVAARREAGGPPLAGHTLVLIAALAAVAANQGGYYPAGQWLAVLFLAAAFVSALRAHP
jgi:hypothetical protein